MPFSEDFDLVFLNGMCALPQLLQQYHLTVHRADKEAYHHKHLEDNVLRHIDAADIVIADISAYETSGFANVSVMHEVGYASGKDIPVILVGKKGTYKLLPDNGVRSKIESESLRRRLPITGAGACVGPGVRSEIESELLSTLDLTP
jgi:hypothetical protein